MALGAACVASAFAADLRVCADPNNLPYSNSRGEGFENRLAAWIGLDLHRAVTYLWMPQRGKFFNALRAGACDVVLGIPAGMEGALSTQPYYRSSYAFVTRRDRHLRLSSLDDPRLHTLRIGLHAIAADDADAPPAQALAKRGMLQNVRWYRLTQNYLAASRPAVLLQAVEQGDVDVAIAWGPLAGYFARHARTPLEVTPVAPGSERFIPLAFDIAVGVRPGGAKLVSEVNAILARRRLQIRRLLEGYGIPLVGPNR